MRNKSKQIPCGILYLALFIIGLCMGSLLCCGIHLWRNRTDRAQTQTDLSEKQAAELLEHKETVWTQERGADGLCYQWDSKTQRFVEESFCIRDCLEGQDIYTGNVIRYDTKDLKNEKYYQYLFWEGLRHPLLLQF